MRTGPFPTPVWVYSTVSSYLYGWFIPTLGSFLKCVCDLYSREYWKRFLSGYPEFSLCVTLLTILQQPWSSRIPLLRVFWINLYFSFLRMLQLGNSPKAVSWDNYKAHLAFLPFLSDHCPSVFYVQHLENHVLCLVMVFQVGKKISLY